MQVKAVFAERLAVVRYVEHCRVKALRIGPQQIDGLAQHVIGVAQGVVVSVDDLLA
ncbi:hypothetical protein D3C83_93270 [compost metagenome]